MPTIDVRVPELAEPTKRRLAADIAEAFTGEGISVGDVSLFFHHPLPADIALGGRFPFPDAYARVAIFVGGVDDQQKQQIAERIGEALVAAGIPEEQITVAFRPIDPRGVFVGRGRSPW